MSKHARRSAPGVFLAGVFLTLLAGVFEQAGLEYDTLFAGDRERIANARGREGDSLVRSSGPIASSR